MNTARTHDVAQRGRYNNRPGGWTQRQQLKQQRRQQQECCAVSTGLLWESPSECDACRRGRDCPSNSARRSFLFSFVGKDRNAASRREKFQRKILACCEIDWEHVGRFWERRISPRKKSHEISSNASTSNAGDANKVDQPRESMSEEGLNSADGGYQENYWGLFYLSGFEFGEGIPCEMLVVDF